MTTVLILLIFPKIFVQSLGLHQQNDYNIISEYSLRKGVMSMAAADITVTMKLHLNPDEDTVAAFKSMATAYMDACNYVSEHMFNHGFCLNST